MRQFKMGFFALITLLFLLLVPAQTPAEVQISRSSKPVLKAYLLQLDKCLENQDSYIEKRESRLRLLRSMLSIRVADEQKYVIYSNCIEEYKAFRFDSTMSYVSKNIALARKMNNLDLINESLIKQGLLYTTSGNFLEASDILYRGIDSTTLSPAVLPHYYQALLRLAVELEQYSQNDSISRHSHALMEYYRKRLMDILPPDSEERLSVEIDYCMQTAAYNRADSLSTILVSQLDSTSHEFAIAAYFHSTLFRDRGDASQQAIWLARSAIADIKGAIKDHASLAVLSELLFKAGDVERAFQYVGQCMNDAAFYNAKLRPWQLSLVLPTIERSYLDRRQSYTRSIFWFMLALALMTVLLVALVIYLVSRARKLHKIRQQLMDLNTKLKELNAEILESNVVKEEYIGLFLTMLSERMEALRAFRSRIKKQLRFGKVDELLEEVSDTSFNERETQEFYELFDSAFLRLYPDFVEAFNQLLDPDEQIELKKEGCLNTELRIFALIRLGINDSSKIASLLRYSVNTIYNYRTKMRNKARGNRNLFEERIQKIGSFQV